jgi:AraC-like DNA-binding protein
MTSHSHFSSVFRRVFGTTPSRVRQSAGISIRRRARAR